MSEIYLFIACTLSDVHGQRTETIHDLSVWGKKYGLNYFFPEDMLQKKKI